MKRTNIVCDCPDRVWGVAPDATGEVSLQGSKLGCTRHQETGRLL